MISPNITDSRTQDASPLAGAMLTIISLLIIVLNLAVIFVLILDKKLRSDLHCMVLLSLSMSDFLSGLTCMSIALQFHALGELNLAGCFTIYFMFMVASSTSLMQISFICIERIVGLKFPHRFRSWFSVKKIILYIAMFWVTACIIVGIPSSVWIGNEEGVALGCKLGTAYEDEDTIIRFSCVVYFILYSIIAISFSILIRMLQNKRLNKIGAITSKDSQAGRLKPGSTSTAGTSVSLSVVFTDEPTTVMRDLKPGTDGREAKRKVITKVDSDMEAIKALGIVIIIVSILIVPANITIFIDTLLPNFTLSSEVFAFLIGIAICFALCDPIVYALTLTKFQMAIKRIHKRICSKFNRR